MLGFTLALQGGRNLLTLVLKIIKSLSTRASVFGSSAALKSILNNLKGLGLLDSAVVVTTPTAYSTGILHSVKPVEVLGADLIVNGGFDTDTAWTKGTGWSISGGKASCDGTQTSSTLLTQSSTVGANKKYRFTFTISNRVSGSVSFSAGGFNFTTTFSSNGTHTVDLYTAHASSNNIIYISAVSTFIGSIDNVSVKQTTDADFDFTRASSGTRINEQGVVELMGANIPRFTWEGGKPSLLLEPQSTNLYLNSDAFVTQNNSTTAQSYTVSFRGTGTITFSGSYTGSLVGTGVSNRVSLTFTATAGTLTSTKSGTITTAQLEALPYSTSYIPTAGTTVTRSADVCNNADVSTVVNNAEGTMYVEIAALANNSSERWISISDKTTNNRLYLFYYSATNGIAFAYQVGAPPTQVFKTFILGNDTDYAKIAFTWKENNSNIYVNGTNINFDNNCLPFPANTLNTLSFDNGVNAAPFYGKTRALKVFNRALTDQELIDLTT